MSQDGRDDHRMHPSAAELGGDGVTNVVQAGGGMHPCPARQPLERAGERIRIEEEPVALFAHQGDRPALLIEGVVPSRAEGDAPPELFPSVAPDPCEGEGRQLNDPTSPLPLERSQGRRVGAAAVSDRLNAASDGDRALLEVDVLPRDAEDFRAAGPGDRGQEERNLPDRALGGSQQAPQLRRSEPLQFCPSDLGALDRGDGVGGDQPFLPGLAEGGAEDPRTWAMVAAASPAAASG